MKEAALLERQHGKWTLVQGNGESNLRFDDPFVIALNRVLADRWEIISTVGTDSVQQVLLQREASSAPNVLAAMKLIAESRNQG